MRDVMWPSEILERRLQLMLHRQLQHIWQLFTTDTNIWQLFTTDTNIWQLFTADM